MCISPVWIAARRMPCVIHGEMMRHEVLLAQGWHLQTLIDEPRLSELAENYRSLGYAVFILREGVSSGCGACYQGSSVGALYLRRAAHEEGEPIKGELIDDDELFGS